MVDAKAIEEWCIAGELPSHGELVSALVDEGGSFTSVEGQFWDFKDEWPFSYSDAYFGGICRLICAFSNASGGMIIFGVDDKTREGGKNKVRPNADKLVQSFEQITGRKFDFNLVAYPSSSELGAIDVLLIKPRRRGTTPITFLRSMGGYDAGVIWVRSGNQVVRAEPQHFPTLFLELDQGGADGSIPPSTAQIKRFIGRAEAMTSLFDLLQNSDQPRTYLYGKGGSGKTTIAMEFAKLVKAFGGGVSIEGKSKVDIVLFLSAKERELVSASAQVVGIDEPDFYDEESLLRKIISLSGGAPDLRDAAVGEVSAYRRIVSDYLDAFSYLIVIDDIDTLTTKGVDPGADSLYLSLARARKRSKVLYTTRNAPSQSIHNSIEVPGLQGDDYNKFVDECIAKFKTSQPSKEFREAKLPKLSEGRPLVIEAIIALSRTAGGFDNAERLFLQNIGDDIRDYVFSREWDSLPGGLERPLLAALADLNRPSSFEDLKIVLQAGDSTIRDAIGSVREMFLSVDEAGAEAFFFLAPLTRGFVNSRKSNIALYPAIKERVSNFKKTAKITSPEVARIIAGVRRHLPLRLRNYPDDALRTALGMVRDGSLSARITEDRVFRAAKGYVEAVQLRPNMPTVRGDFEYSIQMRHEPEFEELLAWFDSEKNAQSSGEYLYKIADVVVSGRRYTEEQKISMISRRATTCYNLAKDRIYDDMEYALKGFRESLLLHLKAFKLNALSGSPMLETSERYARNTAYQWFRLVAHGDKWDAINSFSQLERDCDGYLDPVADPFSFHLKRLTELAMFAAEKSRVHNEAKRLLNANFDRNKWMDTTVLPALLSSVRTLVDATRGR